MCGYQGVRNVSFSENFTYLLNGWLLSKCVEATWYGYVTEGEQTILNPLMTEAVII